MPSAGRSALYHEVRSAVQSSAIWRYGAQTRLAEQCGVSRAAVSQMLRTLAHEEPALFKDRPDKLEKLRSSYAYRDRFG